MHDWTKEDVDLLVERYETTTNSELLKIFPGRTKLAIYKKANKLGLRKTRETKFMDRSEANSGENAYNWNGGVQKTQKGYVMVRKPGHPRADSKGYVMEHILTWETETGTIVPRGYCVHHINGNKSDNRIENLRMMKCGEHTALHNEGRKMKQSTKNLIAKKARNRLSDKRNHPFYKDVDVKAMIRMREKGACITDICRTFGISKRTYYKKIQEETNGTQ